MEKMFWLKAISEKKQRKITKRDGSEGIITWHDLILTNGLDTIIGESSENLTNLIDSTDENLRLDINVDDCYMCRFTLSVVPYEKNGVTSNFMKCIIHQMVRV